MKINQAKQYIRQLLFIISKYSFVLARYKGKPTIIIMFDNTVQHGGLLDRIKGIISAKVIAEELQYQLGIYADEASFNVFKFLKPHCADIPIKKTQLVYNIWSSRPVVLYNIFHLDKLSILKMFRKRKQQYHFYCNADLLKNFYPQLSQQELQDKWRFYFYQLFYFDDYFNSVYQQLFSTKAVIGIHLRFQALLGDNVENGTILPQKQQMELIAACIGRLKAIQQEHLTKQLLVVSDSTLFLHTLKQSKQTIMQDIIFAEGKITHIDFVHDEAILKKALLDFYLLARCSVIYQILANGMYNSQFCRYAAVLGKATYNLEKI